MPVIGWLVRRWTLASAIRPEELARMLSLRSQELRNTGDKAGIAVADRIDSALGSADPETARRIRMLKMAFHDLAPNYALQIDKSPDPMTTASQQAIGNWKHGLARRWTASLKDSRPRCESGQ